MTATLLEERTVEKEQSRSSIGRGRKYALLSFLLPFIAYVLTLHYYSYIYGVNIVAVQYALWFRHSISVGSHGGSVLPGYVPNLDNILFHGKYYNAYAPGLAFLSFPFFLMGLALQGGKVVAVGYALLADELFVALAAATACYVLYRVCRLYSGQRESSVAALALGLATTVWPFADVSFPHDVTLLFTLISLYLVLKYSHAIQDGVYSSPALIALSGLSLAVAAVLDYVSMVFAIPLFVYIFFIAVKSGRGTGTFSGLFVFCVLFFFGVLLDLSYNWLIFKSPFTFPEQFFSESPTRSHTLLSLAGRFYWNDAILHAGYNLVSPYRGILVLSPVLLLGIYGLYQMLRTGRIAKDALLFASLFIIYFLTYSSWDMWDAGGSYGQRFLIPAIPLLVIPISVALEQNRGKMLRGICFVLFSASVVMQGLGAFTSSAPPLEFDVMYFQPTMFAIPQIVAGHLAVWWLVLARLSPLSTADQIFATIMLLAVITTAGVLLALMNRGVPSPSR